MKKQALLFYLSYPFLYIVAILPFRLLYQLSDVLYHLLMLSGYRKKVVLNNLRNSFPKKSRAELDAIFHEYYRYLCDLILETFKTLKMTEREARDRCLFRNEPWLDQLHENNKSIIVVMGHYGNWEWAGPAFTLNTKYQLVVIYRPLSNPYFEKMTSGMRTKFGTRITPVHLTLRDMVASRKQLTATAFIADQAPSPDNALWIDFLHQDTAFYTGPEKLARKFNYPIVYMNVRKIRRGYYEVVPELLTAEPLNTEEGAITEIFAKRLEKEILNYPVTWLWSHRRWKHQRTSR